MTGTASPVIFLSFANDPVSGVSYLRNLPAEARQGRAAFARAEQVGLGEVVERANATVTKIVGVLSMRLARIPKERFAWLGW